MKKLLAVLLILVMVFTFAACGGGESSVGDEFDYDAISDTCESEDGTYALAFVTDVGQLKDKSFNQGTWEGLKRYASENEKTYKYYQPANGNEATDDDRYDAMKLACDSGAEVVVCAGFMQETALKKAAAEFADVMFVFIDGYPVSDANGNNLTNVAPISFQEEQSGYLAGYAAVMEGYTKLGFSGGGGGTNPACMRFGYGFLQGADAAAVEKDVDVEVNYSWEYGASFSPSTDLQAMLSGWYTSGTECIFVCGGNMCQSAFAAASAADAAVIGVDVDQSGESDTVITSATKGLREATMFALDKFYTEAWDEIGGVSTVLGAADDAVGLPTATWSLQNYTVEQYGQLYNAVKNGEVQIKADAPEDVKTVEFERVTVK